MKISKRQAPEIRAVELATPTMVTWNICTRWDRNLSASLPVTREKKKDDNDQAMTKNGALSFDTPVSLEKAGWKPDEHAKKNINIQNLFNEQTRV